MSAEKIVGVTFVLLGIASLIIGIGITYVSFSLSAMMSGNPLVGAAVSASGLGFVMNMMWFMGILEIILGIFSFISAIMLFMHKE
jgi:uncharacterized membrane protein